MAEDKSIFEGELKIKHVIPRCTNSYTLSKCGCISAMKWHLVLEMIYTVKPV